MYRTDTIAIKKIMLDKNIESIKKLAEILEINRNTVGAVVNGRIRPTANFIEKFATKLDLNSEEISLIFFKKKLS